MSATTVTRQDVPSIAPLRHDWLPAGGPDWLESRRVWHVGQLRAYQRTLRALREARGGDFEGLAEDERLAATELLRIVTTIASDLRSLDEPVARRVDCTDRTVWRVRRWLRLDSDQAPAAVAGERPSIPVRACRRASRGLAPRAAGDGARSVANSSELAHVRGLAA